MHSRSTLVALALAVLALAGCGGTKTVTVTASSSTTASAPPPKVPLQSATYPLTLSPTTGVSSEFPAPAGAPGASGNVTVTINAPMAELCWQFSNLHNVTDPTAGRLYRLAGFNTWRFGIPLGHGYQPSGCIGKPPATLRLIQDNLQEWYVSIHTAKYPGGALRAQL
jgi:hypothetical protein